MPHSVFCRNGDILINITVNVTEVVIMVYRSAITQPVLGGLVIVLSVCKFPVAYVSPKLRKSVDTVLQL